MTRKCRILQVDDDWNDLFLLSHAVRTAALPVEVYAAAGGGDALLQLPDVKPDLVLLDLNMPAISGFEVLAGLKRSAPHLPVVIFSSASEPADIDRAKHLGADGYYVKPYGLIDLVAFVRSLYEHWCNQSFKWPNVLDQWGIRGGRRNDE